MNQQSQFTTSRSPGAGTGHGAAGRNAASARHRRAAGVLATVVLLLAGVLGPGGILGSSGDADRVLVSGAYVERTTTSAAEILAAANPTSDTVAQPEMAAFDPSTERPLTPPRALVPVARAASPAPTSPPPPATSHVAQGTGVWAVVIGIDDYPGTDVDLGSAVADSRAFLGLLQERGVPSHQIRYLENSAATGTSINRSLDWLVANAGPQSTAVVFYAGHVVEVTRTTEALLTGDWTQITDASLAQRLRPLVARQAWVVIAACYGGGFDELLRPGLVLTGASDGDSLAYESSRYGHSYVVEFLINRQLRQSPGKTVQSAFQGATSELRRDHPNRLPVQLGSSAPLVIAGPDAPVNGVAAAPPAAATTPPSDSGSADAPRQDQGSTGGSDEQAGGGQSSPDDGGSSHGPPPRSDCVAVSGVRAC